MRAHLELFLLAVSFYTRLPVPNNLDFSKLPQANVYLPLIGWLVGGVMAVCFYLANLVWPQTIAVILAIASGILLTGAFHEDGFADVCDGFGGGYSKQRILEIMKDSQIGTYGAIGLILIMAIKISMLAALPVNVVPMVLLASHSLSRLPPLLLMRVYYYARTDASKSSAAVYKPSLSELCLACVIALLPMLLLPPACSLAIPVVLLVNWHLGRYFLRGIGGYTGDCLGTSQQVAEVVFYLCVGAVWTST